MNVYTFRIEIKSLKKYDNYEDEIINRFKENSFEKNNYSAFVQKCGNNEAEHIRVMYNEGDIVAREQESLSRYYVTIRD